MKGTRHGHFPYWIFPVIAGSVWVGMLLGMLIHWVVDTNRTKYGSMGRTQTIAYISDVGAAELKPLFVTGCIVSTIFLDLSFGFDRWLRHRGRLVPNTSLGEKVLSGLTIFFAFVGTVGLTCLSGFDTARYPKLHDIFLILFIAGYLLSAVFICWEYQRLGIKYREHRVLRISFWVKLVFIIVELGLAIGFGVCNLHKDYDNAAVLEWTVAYVFTFYVFSFVIDLWPARHTTHGRAFKTTGMNATPAEVEDARDYYPPTTESPVNPRYTQDSQRPLNQGPSGRAHAHF